jgi:tryptophan synthase beta chain
MVRDLQSIIGKEAREQILAEQGALPNALVACVGGGSNSIGLFHPFLQDAEVEMYGVEAGGHGLETGRHSASVCAGSDGVLHGARTMLLQDDDGQVSETHSIAAGLDYSAVGPEHSFLNLSGRVRYSAVCDADALDAFKLLSRLEGIIPALESAHAVSFAVELARSIGKKGSVIVNLSGRGDKDVAQVSEMEATS